VHRATVEQTKGAAEVINATEEMAVLVRNSVKNTQHLLEAAKELTEKAELLTSTLDEYGEGGTPVSSNRMLRAETEQ
jgi:methyl-accepting chemotaxis protein